MSCKFARVKRHNMEYPWMLVISSKDDFRYMNFTPEDDVFSDFIPNMAVRHITDNVIYVQPIPTEGNHVTKSPMLPTIIVSKGVSIESCNRT